VAGNHIERAGFAGTVYIHTVYDHVFGDFPAKNTVYIYIVCVGFWPTFNNVYLTFHALFAARQ
jgi:hypothetical protein